MNLSVTAQRAIERLNILIEVLQDSEKPDGSFTNKVSDLLTVAHFCVYSIRKEKPVFFDPEKASSGIGSMIASINNSVIEEAAI